MSLGHPRSPVWVGLLALLGAAFFAACPPKTPCDSSAGCADGGGPPPYICTSAQVAASNPACQVAPGSCITDFISGQNVVQWYEVTVPASADAKTLMEFAAGFDAGTTVVLEGQLYTMSGGNPTRLGDPLVDPGTGLDFVVPAPLPSTQMVISLGDKFAGHSNANVDLSHPFTFCARSLEDPDPNGSTPTVLVPQGQSSGTKTGVLSTVGREDKFTLDVPAGRQIIYLNITGGCTADGGAVTTCVPAPSYLLQYTLRDPGGLALTQANMATQYFEDDAGLPIDLVTARLAVNPQTAAADPGTWELDVQGLDPNFPTSGVPAPGDLRVQYTVHAQIFPDVDPYEPNDTIAEATTNNAVTFSGPGAAMGQPPGHQVLSQGRLSYVGDTDWYAINLPASSGPTLLHYQFQATTNGGRFPPLTEPPTRELILFHPVSAASCGDPTVCPQGFSAEPEGLQSSWQAYAQSACAGTWGQSLCMLSDREEDDTLFSQLQNFEGVVQVPPSSSSQTYYLLVQASTSNVSQLFTSAPYADDLQYQLTLDWYTHPDEDKFWSGGSYQPAVVTLTQDGSYNSSVPSPTPGISGSLAAGYGRIVNYGPWDGGQVGIRGAFDYDAVPSEVDQYQIDFPNPGAGDQAWELKYQVTNDATGAVVHDLALDLSFCDANGCNGVNTLVYDPGAGQWFNYTGQYGPQQAIWDQSVTQAAVTTTTNNYGCWCFPAQNVAAGKFYLNVVAIDRNSYSPANYTVDMSLAPYPQPSGYSGKSCPGADAGGCQF